MDKLIEWVKYWILFGWTRGESLSRFDEKRIMNPFAPTLGRIPKWVLFVLLVIVLVIGLALLVSRLTGVEFVSWETLTAKTGVIGGCFANVGGRVYVAVNCLFITYMPAVLYALLLVAAFIAGYVTRVYIERREEK